jgi:peptide chain release factor subunit 1
MRKSGILQKLKTFEATDKPFISIYLNAEANEHGRDDFNIFLKKQLSVNEDKFAVDSDERKSFDEDLKRINDYAERVSASAEGVAIFACAGEDFFQTYEFDVPFEKNQFQIMNKPHIFPLARMVDQNPQFAVVVADSDEAKIFVMQRGEILNLEEIENEKYSRSEKGGWSQMRFERHIDEMRKQHAKEISDELEKIVRDEDIRQIVLAGNKDVVIPLLKEELSDFLQAKVAGEIRMEISASEDEIKDKANSAIKQFDTLQDVEKIKQLKEENYEGGKGITGVAETLKALANGQVQELYLTSKFDELKYNEEDIQKILEAYAPNKEGKMFDAEHSRQIADDMILRALDSADRIRFIEDGSLLESFGGTAALLRYSMVANQ